MMQQSNCPTIPAHDVGIYNGVPDEACVPVLVYIAIVLVLALALSIARAVVMARRARG